MYCCNIVPGVDVTVKIYRVVSFFWNLYEHIAEHLLFRCTRQNMYDTIMHFGFHGRKYKYRI